MTLGHLSISGFELPVEVLVLGATIGITYGLLSVGLVLVYRTNRVINAAGTAVVLVEQSVNIALDLADHAYFMEKGEIRFDGASADLLAREDLLRAVFLEGVASQDR